MKTRISNRQLERATATIYILAMCTVIKIKLNIQIKPVNKGTCYINFLNHSIFDLPLVKFANPLFAYFSFGNRHFALLKVEKVF